MARVEEESLVHALDNEHALRATHGRAVMESMKPFPVHFTNEQRRLAHQQAEEDIRTIYEMLRHAEQKLQWEQDMKWES
jgi:hypothetical protein